MFLSKLSLTRYRFRERFEQSQNRFLKAGVLIIYKYIFVMKKAFLIVASVLLISSTSFSQGIYIRVGGGYGLPIGTASIGEQYTYSQVRTTVTSDTYSTKDVRASYGAGGDFNLGLGYKYNDVITFDLGIEYLKSKKFETYNKRNYIGTGLPGIDNHITATSAKAFLFNPSVIFKGGFWNGAPYAKFGFILGVPTITKDESSFDNTDGTSAWAQTWKYKKGIAFGYQSGVGMNWKLSEKMDLFSEIDFVSMTYYAKEGNLTKYVTSNDGITWKDYLPSTVLSQRQIVFKNSFDPNVYNDGSKPTVALKKSTPFSSISLQIGIKYMFGKKKD